MSISDASNQSMLSTLAITTSAETGSQITNDLEAGPGTPDVAMHDQLDDVHAPPRPPIQTMTTLGGLPSFNATMPSSVVQGLYPVANAVGTPGGHSSTCGVVDGNLGGHSSTGFSGDDVTGFNRARDVIMGSSLSSADDKLRALLKAKDSADRSPKKVTPNSSKRNSPRQAGLKSTTPRHFNISSPRDSPRPPLSGTAPKRSESSRVGSSASQEHNRVLIARVAELESQNLNLQMIQDSEARKTGAFVTDVRQHVFEAENNKLTLEAEARSFAEFEAQRMASVRAELSSEHHAMQNAMRVAEAEHIRAEQQRLHAEKARDEAEKVKAEARDRVLQIQSQAEVAIQKSYDHLLTMKSQLQQANDSQSEATTKYVGIRRQFEASLGTANSEAERLNIQIQRADFFESKVLDQQRDWYLAAQAAHAFQNAVYELRRENSELTKHLADERTSEHQIANQLQSESAMARNALILAQQSVSQSSGHSPTSNMKPCLELIESQDLDIVYCLLQE